MPGFFSRTLLAALLPLFAATSGILAASAADDGPQWVHATALTGTPKYGPDVDHFDYVNPDAPKGGRVRLATQGGFDTFNPILPRGNPAPGIGLTMDSLMEPALDELNISAVYELIAEATRHPADDSWVEFRLNPKARWYDGTPITVEDVIWSFNKLVEINPSQSFYYRNVVKAEKVADGVVRFTFDVKNNRELPNIMGQLPVLPKHWWEGTDANGKKRDISKSTLEPPLGSGHYRIKDFEANRWVVYERVKDYWAADLPVRKGTNNFDEIRYDSYRDTTVTLEAFKGDQFDFRQENSAKNWATGYDFPARKEGKVILESFPDKARGVMQAFVMNLRRDKFKDERVREALNYAFDFETANRTTFYGQYKRIDSYFAGTELASSGLSKGKELEILESVRDLVPPEVFTKPYTNPVGGDPQKMRANLRKALSLLKEAGYELKGQQLVNGKMGEPLEIEFMDNNPNSERYVLPFANNLKRIGITLTMRVLDTPQYINRIRSRDFDMTTLAWGESLSPGNEQRDYWGSEAADRNQSRNYAGIKDKGVDALIDKVIFAKTREDLVAATHALDRVLLAHHYVIPQFYLDVDRTARWDRFGHPKNMTGYTTGFPEIWWWDKEKAAKVGDPR
ncbi:extracellular solute-binding protein [Breoghania sp.]|uniref:extracellular solute-binding protein n=1 Tax=Breoghania sp. TaxID=2065378 RepID=UPI00260E514D|nr:extracellular solute-binding protein [Breoghania sp.]MDJ0930326.1 extracellular solute-binding protein [Breoghania sp.]